MVRLKGSLCISCQGISLIKEEDLKGGTAERGSPGKLLDLVSDHIYPAFI